MDCRAVRPLLSAYMDNEVTPDELRLVQEHVAGCADCAAILASYRQLRTAVRALPPPPPPPGLRAAVFAHSLLAARSCHQPVVPVVLRLTIAQGLVWRVGAVAH